MRGFLIGTLLLLSSPSWGYTELCVNEQETLAQIQTLIDDARAQNLSLSLEHLFYENPRKLLRSLYLAGRQCPTLSVYRHLVAGLLNLNFDPKYLHSILGPESKHLGLRLYQIGAEWNRTPLQREKPPQSFPLNNLYRALSIVGRPKINTKDRLVLRNAGGGFLIGVFANKPIIATALHNLDQDSCKNSVFHFPSGKNKVYAQAELIGAWPEVDFALCALDVAPDDLDFFVNRQVTLDFTTALIPNTPLSTIGFGVHNNPAVGQASAEESPDCQTLLGHVAKKLISGTFMLPTGCDASPGDSGSPVALRSSGKVVGFFARVPGVTSPTSIDEIKSWRNTPLEPNLWAETTLMIPMSEVAKAFRQSIANPEWGSPHNRSLLLHILNAHDAAARKNTH